MWVSSSCYNYYIPCSVLATLERLAVCPGDTVNLNCTIMPRKAFAEWSVSCNASSCDLVDENIGIFEDQTRNSTLCHQHVVAGDSTIFISYNFISGVSNMNITIPRHPTITHLGVACQSTCRYLYVIGKLC
jgi:hypothetical protein